MMKKKKKKKPSLSKKMMKISTMFNLQTGIVKEVIRNRLLLIQEASKLLIEVTI